MKLPIGTMMISLMVSSSVFAGPPAVLSQGIPAAHLIVCHGILSGGNETYNAPLALEGDALITIEITQTPTVNGSLQGNLVLDVAGTRVANVRNVLIHYQQIPQPAKSYASYRVNGEDQTIKLAGAPGFLDSLDLADLQSEYSAEGYLKLAEGKPDDIGHYRALYGMRCSLIRD